MINHFQIPFAADRSISVCGLVGHINTPHVRGVDCENCKRTLIFQKAWRYHKARARGHETAAARLRSELSTLVVAYLDSKEW